MKAKRLANNEGLSLGRWGYRLIKDGNAVTPPADFVFGIMEVTVAGSLTTCTHSAINTGSDNLTDIAMPAGVRPLHASEVEGDGTIRAILWLEPATRTRA